MHADRRLLKLLTPILRPALRWNHNWAIARAMEGLEPYVASACESGGLSGKATPATKALERAKVPVKTHAYEHDPKHESYGLEAAEALGLDPATVFKTLVADVDGKLTVAIVRRRAPARPQGARGRRQGQEGADGRRQAGRADHRLRRRRHLPARPEARRSRPCSTQRALEHEAIHVSGGRRGLEIELAPADLRRLTNAVVAPISR